MWVIHGQSAYSGQVWTLYLHTRWFVLIYKSWTQWLEYTPSSLSASPHPTLTFALEYDLSVGAGRRHLSLPCLTCQLPSFFSIFVLSYCLSICFFCLCFSHLSLPRCLSNKVNHSLVVVGLFPATVHSPWLALGCCGEALRWRRSSWSSFSPLCCQTPKYQKLKRETHSSCLHSL